MTEPAIAVHHCRDVEDYANDGFESAMTQHLADNPAAADEWLAEHDAVLLADAATVDSGPLTGKVTHADWQIVVDVLLGEIARLRDDWRDAPAVAKSAIERKIARVARIRGQIIEARRNRRAGAT